VRRDIVEYLHSRCCEKQVFLSTLYLVSSCMYEMDGTRGTLGRQKRCVHGFDGETLGKENSWKTEA